MRRHEIHFEGHMEGQLEAGMTISKNIQAGDAFTIGEENLLVASHEGAAELSGEKQRELLEDIRVRIGTLLKTETVSFLLGAGASVDCGGQLIGSVPLVVEQTLHEKGVTGTERPRIRKWLKVFYFSVRWAGGGDNVPVTRESIIRRRDEVRGDECDSLKANFEQVLAMLIRWRAALPENGGRLWIDGSPPLDAKAEDIDSCIEYATRALAHSCELPTSGKEDGLKTYKNLIRKLLTRPLNLKRVNVFTLNYDTLVEKAADAEGVVLLDGFVGTQCRVFRPESYEQDLYFPAETTEGRVHRFDRVLHLYKLHGSITWTAKKPTIDDPYGVQSGAVNLEGERVLIYPTPAKYGETLGMPYSELFRRFAGALSRPQSILFVIGYGFGDEHVNAIIRQALAIPSFTLVIVDPCPKSDFVNRLREQKDRRVWIIEGPTLGKLAGFVEHILPDLRDEDIRQKVLSTYRALAKNNPPHGDDDYGE